MSKGDCKLALRWLRRNAGLSLSGVCLYSRSTLSYRYSLSLGGPWSIGRAAAKSELGGCLLGASACLPCLPWQCLNPRQSASQMSAADRCRLLPLRTAVKRSIHPERPRHRLQLTLTLPFHSQSSDTSCSAKQRLQSSLGRYRTSGKL